MFILILELILFYIYSHPWETVTQAVWRKYPNPFKPEVEATDVIDRRIGENGNLYTKRLISTRWGLPGWAKKVNIEFYLFK